MRWTVVVYLVACGGGSSDDSPAIDARVDDARIADAAPPRRNGFVMINSVATATLYQQNAPVDVAAGTSGPCQLNPGTGTPTPSVSAGPITIVGTTTPITIMPSGSAPTIQYTSSPASFAAAASITVTAPGTAEYPPFMATAIAPASITGWTPPAFIDTNGYTATWTPANAPQFDIVVFTLNALSQPMFLRCRVPDTGSYTIQQAAFQLMPSAGSPAQVILIRTHAVDSTNVRLTISTSILASDIPYN